MYQPKLLWCAEIKVLQAEPVQTWHTQKGRQSPSLPKPGTDPCPGLSPRPAEPLADAPRAFPGLWGCSAKCRCCLWAPAVLWFLCLKVSVGLGPSANAAQGQGQLWGKLKTRINNLLRVMIFSVFQPMQCQSPRGRAVSLSISTGITQSAFQGLPSCYIALYCIIKIVWMVVQQARTLFTDLLCYWCTWGQEIQIEQIIRREVCGAEQTHQAWEDFLLWKGREIAFTELPGLGLSIHEKPRTCRFTYTRSSACSIAVPLLGFENRALYRPNSPVA